MRLTKRRWMALAAAGLGALFVFAVIQWKGASDRGGQQPVEPFRIAGNLYYVGANVATSYLVTGPEGHVLIDGGYPGTAPMIIASIRKLGFDIKDVKVLLNSHAHFDHAGGLAALQAASGAQLWISEGDANIVAAGGAGDPIYDISPAMAQVRRLPRGDAFEPAAFVFAGRLLIASGLARYPAPRIDHRFRDGDTVRVGPVSLIGHVTPGHTPGCTSWEIPVHDSTRELRAVNICSLAIFESVSLLHPEMYPGIRAAYEHSFATLRSIPADIFLAQEARDWGMRRKVRERETAADPVAPFIDPAGYRKLIDDAEQRFREALAYQQEHP